MLISLEKTLYYDLCAWAPFVVVAHPCNVISSPLVKCGFMNLDVFWFVCRGFTLLSTRVQTCCVFWTNITNLLILFHYNQKLLPLYKSSPVIGIRVFKTVRQVIVDQNIFVIWSELNSMKKLRVDLKLNLYDKNKLQIN